MPMLGFSIVNADARVFYSKCRCSCFLWRILVFGGGISKGCETLTLSVVPRRMIYGVCMLPQGHGRPVWYGVTVMKHLGCCTPNRGLVIASFHGSTRVNPRRFTRGRRIAFSIVSVLLSQSFLPSTCETRSGESTQTTGFRYAPAILAICTA